MKANELSVGDWVRILNYHWDGSPSVAQIDGIVKKHGTYYLQFGSALSAEIDRCEPIPLTQEILEKNGFEFIEVDKLSDVRRATFYLSRMNGLYKYLNKTKKGFVKDCVELGYSELHKEWVIIQMFGKEAVINSGGINNIHELQHALRLCGIEKEIEL